MSNGVHISQKNLRGIPRQRPGDGYLVDIRMSNGVHISQKNLSYEGLKSLVEKLEVLC